MCVSLVSEVSLECVDSWLTGPTARVDLSLDEHGFMTCHCANQRMFGLLGLRRIFGPSGAPGKPADVLPSPENRHVSIESSG